MATYAIGDLQGCFSSLEALLKTFHFSPKKDHLWFVGDIVNRGTQSLECLEFIIQQKDRAQMVLGNHDIFLLACALGFQTPKKGDTLDAILHSTKLPHFVDFLRRQPLLFEKNGFCMVHAGILPSWSVADAFSRAAKVQALLQNNASFLQAIWDSASSGDFEQERLTINVLTRMRFLKSDGSLDLDFKGETHQAPPGLIPWFQVPRHDACTLLTGHWSALGLKVTPHWIALDSGCLWGRELTAVRLEDRAIFQVPQQEKSLPISKK